MKKIPTLFKRNPDNRARVLNEPNPDCAWVFAGEGVATRKYDGTCCLIKNDRMYKRREIKRGKTPPSGFVQADYDENTGKTVGWVPVDFSAENRWHVEALCHTKIPMEGESCGFEDGTYELIGPKIQGNPEGYPKHTLISHAHAEEMDAPRTYVELADWLRGRDIEGIVWHHPDGRMAKIKLRDFGLKRR